tara:strand:+ start:615 stop:773 length:159 start_codon:yes stop_codon:yes gene_type:complete
MIKIFKNTNVKNLKKKYGKYIVVGSFAFFLIKGLIWLIIFLLAGFSLKNINL